MKPTTAPSLPPSPIRTPFRFALPVLLCMSLALLSGCASQKFRIATGQISPTTQVHALNLEPEEFSKAGMAFITPSSITGQEEDKQALALAFTEILRQARPDLRVMLLPETLSAINRQGLTREYRQMFEDYRLTGILDRDALQKVAQVTGMRYMAQLKLGAFRQESKNRFGMMGIRMLETKTSTIRLFFQIWDSADGSVAWEGSQESTVSLESLAEEYVPLKRIVEEAARELVAHLPRRRIALACLTTDECTQVTLDDKQAHHDAERIIATKGTTAVKD